MPAAAHSPSRAPRAGGRPQGPALSAGATQPQIFAAGQRPTVLFGYLWHSTAHALPLLAPALAHRLVCVQLVARLVHVHGHHRVTQLKLACKAR